MTRLRALVAVAALIVGGCRLQPSAPAKEVTDRAPSFALEAHDGAQVQLAELRAQGPAVVVFYRGHWCAECRAQLSGLQDIAGDLAIVHASVVAISVDHPEESRLLAEELGLKFPLLSDPSAAVIDRYGVRMAHEELAIPAVFVVKTDGTIAWRFVAQTIPSRPTNDAVLDVLDRL